MKLKILPLLFLLFAINLQIAAQFQVKNDSIISAALSLIDEDSVEYQLQWLQDMETRFLMASNHKDVAESIKSRFESFGMTEVRLDSFECYTDITYGNLQYDTTTWQYNVEAKIIGSLYPDEEILLMGHQDNVQLDSNPEIFSPGADDNGSGTVAALETARVLMQMGYLPEKTITFLATAAEELMYFGDAGSEYYAQEAVNAGQNIIAVINNDMIAYDEGSSIIGFSNIIGSEEITGIALFITETYTSLTANINSPQSYVGADLQPFLDAGYRGLYLEENIFNPFYHSEMDIVENCDISYLTEVIKISCGSVIYSDIAVGMEDMETAEISMNLYPNPCRDQIHIDLHNVSDVCNIYLMNTSGQVLLSKTMYPRRENIISIMMSDFPAGVYFLKIVNQLQLITAKIIKDR